MNPFLSKPVLFLFLFISSVIGYGQSSVEVDFADTDWQIEAKKYEFVDFKGKKALYLENGKAHLKGINLENGIIDFDVWFDPGRKFLGVHFRVADFLNYEEFYLRPHQSGNPDAMQYTPVFNGLSGWQLYHGNGYSNAYKFNAGEWIHIRLVVQYDQMEVFINDMAQPILFAYDLKHNTQAGSLGFWTFLNGAYFANLSYQKVDEPGLMSPPRKVEKPASEIIHSWTVSNLFSDQLLNKVSNLRETSFQSNLNWESYAVEYSGTLNLAQVGKRTDAENMVLAKVVINADQDQLKRLDFGYSDVAKIYVNDQAVYEGQNQFRSRDYRYLGTIGYFDSIYLDLKKGANEVVFAISEQMGGWGLRAKLADLNGVRIN